jgi:nicotinamidase-related amidase
MAGDQAAAAGALERYCEVYRLAPSELLAPTNGEASEADVVEQAAADYQRDRHNSFELRADDCCLVIVDMQEAFVRPSSLMWVPQAQRILPRLQSLAKTCRALRIPVVLTATVLLPGGPTDLDLYCAPSRSAGLVEGREGTRIVSELLSPGDYVLDTKHTYDAFFGTDLDVRLRAQGTKTVLIAGTLTNYCCEATARGAFDRGYHIVFGSDITATDTAAGHEATLSTMRRGYARVMDKEQVEQALLRGDELYARARNGAPLEAAP